MKESVPNGDGRLLTIYLPWILGLLFTFSAQAAIIEGKVITVADGDSITILVRHQKHRIRLKGIDAPELKQPFGHAAWRALSALVAGKQVRVEYDNGDRYGRIVGVVWVRPPGSLCKSKACRKTLDAGLNQLTVGMAWWFRSYAKEQTPQERGQYEFAETEAKSRQVGLWSESDPTPPWHWKGRLGFESGPLRR